MYSSEKMNKRLSSHDEINMSYDFNVENESCVPKKKNGTWKKILKSK